MIFPFVLFLILVIWSLIDGELYAKEAAIWGTAWLLLLITLILLPGYGVYTVVPMVLIDVFLLVKLVGNPTV